MDSEKFEPKLGDEIPETVLKKSENEIKNGYRIIVLDEFRGKENVEIYIYHPNQKQSSVATNIYAKAFSRLIKDPDILTVKQMEKILRNKRVWGDEEEEKISNLESDMRDIEYEVAMLKKNNQDSPNRIRPLKEAWEIKRIERHELFLEKDSYLANTVERRANEEEIKSKLSLCVKFADGTLVWDSFDAVENEEDGYSLSTIVREAMLFWAGLTQEIIDSLPADLVFGREEEKSENLPEG